jgi:hypothetical protein
MRGFGLVAVFGSGRYVGMFAFGSLAVFSGRVGYFGLVVFGNSYFLGNFLA